jgi:hypothetical protein
MLIIIDQTKDWGSTMLIIDWRYSEKGWNYQKMMTSIKGRCYQIKMNRFGRKIKLKQDHYFKIRWPEISKDSEDVDPDYAKIIAKTCGINGGSFSKKDVDVVKKHFNNK